MYSHSYQEPAQPLAGFRAVRSTAPRAVRSVLSLLGLGRGYAPGGEGRKPPAPRRMTNPINKRTVTGGHSKPIKDYVLPYGALESELGPDGQSIRQRRGLIYFKNGL